MIMDRLERFRCYQRSVPELWDAVRFVERVQKEQLPPGKYPVGKGFAFVQEGNTRSFEEADFEVHRNYLDVQILLDGLRETSVQDKIRPVSLQHGCKESVQIANRFRGATICCPEVDEALDLLLSEIIYILVIDHPKGSIEHVLVSNKR